MKSANWNGILIFTDGACSGNPGPGGWGAVVVTPDGEVTELGGAAAATTNNQMELMGTIEALRHVAELKAPVTLYTDSTYVIRGITQWVWAWRQRGWKTAEGNDVSNRDLWEKLGRLVGARGAEGKVTWLYSRGHVGTPGNERCDEIAVAFSQKKWVDLYQGPLLKYSVAIFDLPEDTALPEMKPKTEKKTAYSYQNMVHGEVYRHKDWPACERRTKGQSGAKFKKAMSAEDEKNILKEWGISASTVIKES